MANRPVLIVGSGCTGLALAQGLKRSGVECIVLEKKEALQIANQRDWNMGLHWAAPILQELLDPALWDRIYSAHVDPHVPLKDIDYLHFYNGATGEQLGAGISVPKWYRLRRSKLRDLLAEGLDIRFGKQLQSIEYQKAENDKSIIASFADGSSIEGCMLVGADGARSTVRNLIAGPSIGAITRLPYAAAFFQSRFSREQALFLRSFHPLYLASPHPRGRFAFFGMQDVPDPNRPETWLFFFYISWPSSLEQQDEEAKTFTNADRLEQVRALSVDYVNPWKSAFEWLHPDTPCWYFGLTAWDPSEISGHSWSNHSGLVTLAGDAAHPMTFQRGQGLNHSITDSAKLTRAISAFKLQTPTQSQTAVIHAYEEEMKTRSGEEVRLSIVNTNMLHDWAKVLESPVMKGGLAKKE